MLRSNECYIIFFRPGDTSLENDRKEYSRNTENSHKCLVGEFYGIVGAVSRISDIIQASGVQIVLFIAALQSIQPSMYEVAKIEGATGYETFWKVTFPMVMPHIITNTIYTIVDAFSQSEVVNLAYTTAFTESNYGLSSAFSVISTVITCTMLALVVYFMSKKTFYYN